ncbi:MULTISPECIES: hypothetical protein [Rhizobium]|jgi:hypothetical protein|uniref:Uncharacterized protein n=1 Tax=Rhizobium altiplani TaxID=1864509 RepID=A0A120FFJ1_9HYPH|nr:MULTISPECIES: hypothetical protein [Rhizobium]KWV42872.1 hypothetical protein AS026_20300 [Rhizobium altiplani]
MTTHDHNPLLGLYGTPRAVIHSRVSARTSKTTNPASEQEDAQKMGNSIVSLICLKDQKPTSR